MTVILSTTMTRSNSSLSIPSWHQWEVRLDYFLGSRAFSWGPNLFIAKHKSNHFCIDVYVTSVMNIILCYWTSSYELINKRCLTRLLLQSLRA